MAIRHFVNVMGTYMAWDTTRGLEMSYAPDGIGGTGKGSVQLRKMTPAEAEQCANDTADVGMMTEVEAPADIVPTIEAALDFIDALPDPS